MSEGWLTQSPWGFRQRVIFLLLADHCGVACCFGSGPIARGWISESRIENTADVCVTHKVIGRTSWWNFHCGLLESFNLPLPWNIVGHATEGQIQNAFASMLSAATSGVHVTGTQIHSSLLRDTGRVIWTENESDLLCSIHFLHHRV